MEVERVPGACHKHFKTRLQAEAFIEDWKQAVAEVYCEKIKNGLDKGHRHWDMSVNVERLLSKREVTDVINSGVDSLHLERLTLTST